MKDIKAEEKPLKTQTSDPFLWNGTEEVDPDEYILHICPDCRDGVNCPAGEKQVAGCRERALKFLKANEKPLEEP